MRSMPQALLWEMFSHGRWSLPSFFFLAILLPYLFYGALSGFNDDPNVQEFVVLQFAFLPIVIFELAVGLQAAQGPLSRMYALPISSSSIVSWHMFSGALILALETAAASWLLNTRFHVNWPILGPALFAAAAWSAGQVLVSVSIHQSLPGFCLAGTPAILLCLWLQSRYGAWLSPPKHFWNEVTPIEAATLAGTFGICYLMTTWGVNLTRCGERLPTLGIWDWVSKHWDAFTLSRTNRPRFRSAAEAQFWFEWQTKGIALPLIIVAVLSIAVVGGLVSWYLQKNSLDTLFEGVLILGGFLSLLALPAGLFLGFELDTKSVGQREKQLGDAIGEGQFDSGMGSFLSCRPFASTDFSKTLLRTAALSSLLAWLMWFAVFVSCLLVMWWANEFPNSVMPRGIRLLYLPITLLGPWVAMANLCTIGLSGRGSKIFTCLVGSIVSYCILLGVINHFTTELVVTMIHTICITITCALIVAAAIWAYIASRRRQYLSSKTLLAASITASLLVIVAIMLLPGGHLLAYPVIFAFAALVVMPFATVPLAITWNRHRG